uniref:S9 family peptidase n=1 Tax=uncultured Polaribacter sp. TaxID=174711 RepID=UPI002618B35D|nr:prolyl oligopeptidase family serine peptidase [uncultured Polaribacter sp.]
MKIRAILLVLFSIIMFSCYKEKKIDIQAKYDNAVDFLYNNYNNKKVFNLNTKVNWFQDNSGIWFIDYSKEKKEYKTVNFNDYKVKPLFDYDKLKNAISKLNDSFTEINGVSFSNFQPVKEGLSFIYSNEKYIVDLKTYNIKKEEKAKQKEENTDHSLSPDKKWLAYTKNYNLFIKSTLTNREYQLSTSGKKDFQYASYYGWFDKMKGENGNRPDRFFVNWSKDSKYISTSIVDTRNAEKMYLLDWSKDELFKPELLSYYRGSPGDSNMVKITPVIYNIDTKKEVKTKLPTTTHINASQLQWTNTSGTLLARITKRGYKEEQLILLNLKDNSTKKLIEETSNTNVENFNYQLINDHKIVFYSERSGWRQLYLLDISSGKTTRLTSDGYVVNDISYVDKEKEIIYYLASGKEEDNNPYHQQLYSVDFNGNEKLLTAENLHHQINFSKDGKYFVDNMSTIQEKTKTVLRVSETGKIVAELTTSNVDWATQKGWESPIPFSLIGKDNKTTIYGAYWKPTHFSASEKYPIIDATYTGPHTQRFPKSFDRAFANQAMAELGFIVVQIDGLGTTGRSKAFRDFSYKNMGNNLEDHVKAIKHLANENSFIDIDKVGIFGHSAGGYDTGRALLAFPDFYKVGVSSSADHDFRMEKAWWPEMYQGWPVDNTYHEISNITNAKNLKGKLLITHGGLDDNVNPSATFKLAEAFIKADKEFDLLILPSQRHGYTGIHRDYFIKKLWSYFVEHLLNEEPIWDITLKNE